MFQLPPTTAAPPSFGMQPQYQQQPQQPVPQTANAQWMAQQQQPPQNMNPGVGTLAPQPDPQQPAQQSPFMNNLSAAIQQMPRPGFNYQNNGLQTRVGPQLRGMPGVVRPPPLMGGSPQQALSQGNRMPSLVR